MKSAWLAGAALILIDQSLKAWVIYSGLPSYPGHLYSLWLAGAILAALLITLKGQWSWGVVLVLSGGISNTLDLAFRHKVVDIVVLKNLFFNIADVEIVLGTALILISSLKQIIQLSREK